MSRKACSGLLTLVLLAAFPQPTAAEDPSPTPPDDPATVAPAAPGDLPPPPVPRCGGAGCCACCGGPGPGAGFRGGPGFGPGAGFRGGRGPGPGFAPDHEVFLYLLDHRGGIRRQVTLLPEGVDTLTESDDPEVAAQIREHVASMQARVEERRPVHLRDPLFSALFQHADAIEMRVEPTARGARVVETSADPEVARLIQMHAEVVTAFLENGHAEMYRDHLPPGDPAAKRGPPGGGCCRGRWSPPPPPSPAAGG